MAGAAMALVASAAAVSASATELVTNGGFETGSLSGWTLTGSTDHSNVVTSPVHSGAYAYSNGAVGGAGVLSQVVNTVAGQSYDFSFWLRNEGGTPNGFTASLGNAVLQSFTNVGGSFDFTHFTGTVVAATNGSTLSFAFRQDPSFWELDDVSLTSAVGGVPEPASWAMMITGFLAAGAMIRANRRRQGAVAA